MKRPTHIKIVKRKGEDYFRLSYKTDKGKCIVTTQGFKNRRELAHIIKNDDVFAIDYR